MDAWNNVLDEHCDVTVICMDGTLFLIMYVCCHGWSYVLDTSSERKLVMLSATGL